MKRALYVGTATEHQVVAPKVRGLVTSEIAGEFATTVVTPIPIPCAGCNQSRAVFVNRMGTTLCGSCDATRFAA